MKYVGVDGCKGGWFAVCLGQNTVTWSLHASFSELVTVYNQIQCFFVDIPIGLPATGTREADMETRKALPAHLKSSVFNTPVREAVYANDKAHAKSINEKLTGKSLSEQSLGVMLKIKEVDSYLQKHHQFRKRVYESHPELGFIRLAGHDTRFRKKDLPGGMERLRIIEIFVADAEQILIDIRKKHPASKVASDDVLDAFVLAVSARQCKGSPNFYPRGQKTPSKDETGLPMAIWHA